MPEIAQILRNTIMTTGTLEDREAKLNALFSDVAAFADTARDFLDDERRQHDPARRAQRRTSCGCSRKYAPEFPCLSSGIVNAGKPAGRGVPRLQLHIVLETLPNQPRGYNASDCPRFGDNRGPPACTCRTRRGRQANPVRTQPNFDDGVDEPTGKGTSRVAPGSTGGVGYAGSAEESALLKPCSARPRRHRRRRPRPRRAAGRPDGARGERVTPARSLLAGPTSPRWRSR